MKFWIEKNGRVNIKQYYETWLSEGVVIERICLNMWTKRWALKGKVCIKMEIEFLTKFKVEKISGRVNLKEQVLWIMINEQGKHILECYF